MNKGFRTLEMVERRIKAQTRPVKLLSRPDDCPLCGETFNAPKDRITVKYDTTFGGCFTTRMETQIGKNKYRCRNCSSMFVWKETII